MQEKTEMLEPIYDVLREIKQLEARSGNASLEYTDLDVIAVSAVFLSIISNRKAHKFARQFAGKNMDADTITKVVAEKMENFSAYFGDMVMDMTDVNLSGEESNDKE